MFNKLTKLINSKSDYSTLNIVSDSANWALDTEANALEGVVKQLGINFIRNGSFPQDSKQCTYYMSQFVLGLDETYKTNNRIAVDYYHGLPGQSKEFDQMIEGLEKNKDKVSRIRVSQSIIENFLLNELKISREVVHRIPIGIDIDFFKFQTKEQREKIRKDLNIPLDAVVIGSFQKDGNGWEEGLEPKWVKGPDIFLKTINILKDKIPNLYVLLTGPARGYVKKGLEEMKVSYVHRFVENYLKELPPFYQALDLYIISSREEGGPKSILESMSSGVPLVTTRVGQAVDLVKHEQNAWMAEQEDFEQLAGFAMEALENKNRTEEVIISARKTAEENSYSSQLPLWKNFFTGYIKF